MYVTYRQLFGYGWWGTLWRLAVVTLAQVAVMLIAVVIVIYFYIYDMDEKSDVETIKAFMFIQAVTVALTAVMLHITHRINVKQYNKLR